MLIIAMMCFSSSFAFPVPLVSWSYGDRSVSFPGKVLSGHSVEARKVFQSNLQPYTEDGHILFTFLQDELSVDDFTKYSSSFKHLQKNIQSRKSSVFPSVSQKEQSIVQLVKSNSKLIEVYSNDLERWSLNDLPTDANSILFHLEPVAGSTVEGKKQIFERNDALMAQILNQVKSKVDNFGVVYTAEQPSENIANLLVNEQLKGRNHAMRQLLEDKTSAEPASGRLFNNTGIVFLYLKSLKFGDINNQSELLNATSKKSKNSVCSEGACSISVNTTRSSGNITKFEMLIEMKTNNVTNEWYCDIITVSGDINGKAFPTQNYPCGRYTNVSDFESATYSSIRAPIGMSYGCHDMFFIDGNQTEYTLSLGGLQLQPHITNDAFGNCYHCVGFFSLEILTGIVVVAVLLIGLMIGSMMMMAIQTQDRFDDPKGQTISVPTQD